MSSTRTLALGSLALGTSVWLGCALTGAYVDNGLLLGINLVLLTVAAIFSDHCLRTQIVGSKRAQETDSEGILEGALALPWLICRVRASNADTPSFHWGSVSSILHFAIISTGLLLTVGFQGIWIASGEEAETEQLNGRSKPKNASSSSVQSTLSRALSLASCIVTVIYWHSNGGNVLESFTISAVSLLSVFSFNISIPHLLPVFTIGEGWIVVQGLFLLGFKSAHYILRSIPASREALWTAFTGSHNILVDVENVDNYVFMCIVVSTAAVPPIAITMRTFFHGTRLSTPWEKCLLWFWILWGAGAGAVLFGALLMAVTFVWVDHQKVGMLVYWILCFGAGIAIALHLGKSESIPNIIVRKWFHFLAVALFLPGYILQPKLMKVALTWAYVLLMVLEGTRFGALPYVSPMIHQYMTAFTDSRDSGPVIITHFTLLLGMAIPIWIAPESSYVGLSGVVILGMGDSAAAVAGSRYGRLKIFEDSNKTWEGAVANFISTMLAWCALTAAFEIFVPSLILPSILAAYFEATSSQLDNIFLPILYYSLLSR